jgi:hypothetical protein
VRRAALVAISVALACDPGSDSGADAAEPDDARVERSAAIDGPDALRSTRPRKGTIIGGERVARAVVWPTPATLDAGVRDRMAVAARGELSRSPLPVLVPPDGIERGELYVGEGWYAFTTKLHGQTLSVQGSAQARVHRHVHNEDPSYEIRGNGGYISQNEAIWAVSWIENGAAYSVELECDDPSASACANPDRVLALVDAMVFVGGAGEGGAS